MLIPIVFIHRGNNVEEYLECNIQQAAKENHVIIISDNPSYGRFAEFHDINVYMDYADLFNSCYENLSTQGEYERFCFLRWFILHSFMSRNNIPVCFYLDSDVMFFSDTATEFRKFQQFDMTILHRSSPSSIMMTMHGLTDFCSFVFDTYQQRGFDFDRIASLYTVMQRHNRFGGVCDMTLFEYYARFKNPSGVGEAMFIYDNSTYDHSINQSDRYFEMANGIKNIRWQQGKPYCLQISTNNIIRFVCLHFQGQSKSLVKNIFDSLQI